jgi:hypothetical protein
MVDAFLYSFDNFGKLLLAESIKERIFNSTSVREPDLPMSVVSRPRVFAKNLLKPSRLESISKDLDAASADMAGLISTEMEEIPFRDATNEVVPLPPQGSKTVIPGMQLRYVRALSTKLSENPA